MTPDIDALRNAIKQMHGCDSAHVASSYVFDSFGGKTVWEGHVQVFDLIDHPKAKRCYAWSHKEDNGGERYIAVLELPPVTSAVTAVRAAIVAQSKQQP